MRLSRLLLGLLITWLIPSLSWADIQVQGYLNSAALENLAADPTCVPATTCPDGRIYWNTVASEPRMWDGGAWQQVLIGSSVVPDPLLLGNGTALNPTYSFSLDTDTGMYNAGANDIGFSAGNETRLTLSDSVSSGATFSDPNNAMRLLIDSGVGSSFLRIQASDGVGTSDSVIEFGDAADGDSGRLYYDHSTDNFNFYAATELLVSISDGTTNFNNTNGANTLVVTGNQGGSILRLDANHTTPGAADSILEFGDTADNDVGRIFYDHSADTMSLITSAATRMSISSSLVTINPAQTQFPVGSAGTPSIYFNGDTQTGLFRSGTAVRVSAGGLERFAFGSSRNLFIEPMHGPNGDVVSPTYSFNLSQDSGLALPSGGGIALYFGGATTFFGTANDTFLKFDASTFATTVCANASSGLVSVDNCSSSIRYKKDVVDIPDSESEKVWDLRPVRYTWKESNEMNYGFVAEEVHEKIPLLTYYATEGKEDGTLEIKKDAEGNNLIEGVHYTHMTALLLAEMKKLRTRIEQLEAEK